VHGAELGLANAHCVRQHRLKDRFQLAWRAGDHTQHLGGRGLLLQRFRELAGACLHLVEQPHVLDRDHRLVGEGSEQLDLLVGKGLHRATSQGDDADRAAFPQQRDTEHGPQSAEFLRLAQDVFGIGRNVRHLHGSARDDRSPKHGSSARRDRVTSHVFVVFTRMTVARNILVHVAFWSPYGCTIGLAQPRR
jgi:hypothetical protein